MILYIKQQYKHNFSSNDFFYNELTRTLEENYNITEGKYGAFSEPPPVNDLIDEEEKANYLCSYLEWLQFKEERLYKRKKYSYKNIPELFRLVSAAESSSEIRKQFYRARIEMFGEQLFDLFERFYSSDLSTIEQIDHEALNILCRLFFTIDFKLNDKNVSVITDKRYSPYKHLYPININDNIEANVTAQFAYLFLTKLNCHRKNQNANLGFNDYKIEELRKWRQVLKMLNRATYEFSLVEKYIAYVNPTREWTMKQDFKEYEKLKNNDLSEEEEKLSAILKRLEKDNFFNKSYTSATDFFNYITKEPNKKIVFEKPNYYIAYVIDKLKIHFPKFRKSLTSSAIDEYKLLYQAKGITQKVVSYDSLKKELSRLKRMQDNIEGNPQKQTNKTDEKIAALKFINNAFNE